MTLQPHEITGEQRGPPQVSSETTYCRSSSRRVRPSTVSHSKELSACDRRRRLPLGAADIRRTPVGGRPRMHAPSTISGARDHRLTRARRLATGLARTTATPPAEAAWSERPGTPQAERKTTRWSFTRPTCLNLCNRHVSTCVTGRQTHRPTDPTEFPGHTHRPTDVGYTS